MPRSVKLDAVLEGVDTREHQEGCRASGVLPEALVAPSVCRELASPLACQAEDQSLLSVWELQHLLDKLTVGEMMTYCVMTTAPDRLMTEVIGRMLGHRVGALPVVEDRRVVGILTRTDVLGAFRRLSPVLSVTA